MLKLNKSLILKIGETSKNYAANFSILLLQVKVLKKPRFDVSKLLELHGDSGKATTGEPGEAGSKVDRPEGYEPPVQESV